VEFLDTLFLADELDVVSTTKYEVEVESFSVILLIIGFPVERVAAVELTWAFPRDA